MTPVWPSELPQRPTQQGFSRGVGDGRLITPMGKGPPKVRRRYSAVVKPIRAVMHLSTDQFYRWERFWEEDTEGGTLPFLIIDPMAHGQPLLVSPGVPLLTEAGVPILISSWWLVMFGEAEPQTIPVGGLDYSITFSLNVMP
jgi:hypothetical protein